VKITSFKQRAVFGFATAIFTLIAVTSAALVSLHRVEDTRSKLARSYAEELLAVEELQELGEQMFTAGRGYLIADDAESAERLSSAREAFRVALARAKNQSFSPEAHASIDASESSARAYEDVFNRLIPLRRSGRTGAVERVFETELRPRRDRLFLLLDKFKQQVQERLVRDTVESDLNSNRIFAWALLLILMGGVLAGLLGRYISFSLATLYQKEQQARQLREDILAVVSHDLKAPLTSFVLNCELSMKILEDGEPGDSLKKCLETMKRGSDQMRRMVSDLLDLGRIESGLFTIVPKECGVAELLRVLESMFAAVAAAKQVRLQVSAPDGALNALFAWIDPERVVQAVGNLLSNAIKFTRVGGVVSLGIGCAGRDLEISVRDQGPGIPENEIEHIFDRYRQVNASDRLQGSGLGLYIVKGIVDAHGGRIRVESQLGEGSLFVLIFENSVREQMPSERGVLGA
jgi:signal transduction histidine kinase